MEKRIAALLLLINIFCYSCNQEIQEDCKETIAPLPQPSQINVYLESSSSMKGYIKGGSAFQSTISGMLVDLENPDYFDSTVVKKAFLIGEDKSGNMLVDPRNWEIFRKEIQSAKVEFAQSSPIHKILDQVVSKLGSSEVAIFISDCILSHNNEQIKANPNINVEQVHEMRNDLKQVLNKFKGQNLESQIIALESDFNGVFYDYRNEALTLRGEIRPYYIIVIGKGKTTEAFLEQFRNLPEFRRAVKHELNFKESTPHYILLKQKKMRRKYQIEDPCGNDLGGTIKGKEETFEVVLGLKTKNINPDSISPEEFTISKIPNGTSLKVKEVSKVFSNGHKGDDERIQNIEANFFLTIEVVNLREDFQCKIYHKKKIPKWVTEASTMDDTYPEGRRNKTFAWQDFVKAFNEAFSNPEARSPVDLSLTLNFKYKN